MDKGVEIQLEIEKNKVDDATMEQQIIAGGLSGYSGYSGLAGYSGISGYSGVISGASGVFYGGSGETITVLNGLISTIG